MANSQKNITAKQIILGVVFVFIGFLFSLFIFKYLTRPKPAEFTTSSLPAQQSNAKAVPVAQEQDVSKIPVAIVEPSADITKPLDEEEEVEEQVIPDLVLNGIFTSETGSYALINNKIIKEGEVILGVKLIRIYSNKVELDASGKKVILRAK